MSTFSKNLRGLLAVTAAVMFGVVFSTSALAVGTDAGTQIDNIATVDFKVGGVDQTAVSSGTTTFFVDQVVDVTVAEADGADTDVSPAQLDAVARFTVTNEGNETQDFDLSIVDLVGGTVFGNTDNIDADALTIVIDANDNDVYDAGTDLVQTFIDELSADETAPAASDNVISVFILGDIPAAATDGDAANIELTATAHKAGGAGLGAIEAETGIPDDPATVQIVFANNTGTAEDSYLVGSATLVAVKTLDTISDPIVGVDPDALAIPGAIVEYTVTITNTGTSDATEVTISDDIDADLTLELGSYGVGNDVEIIEGGSAAVYCTADAGDGDGDGCGLTGTVLTVSITPTVPDPDGLSILTTAPDDVAVINFQVSVD